MRKHEKCVPCCQGHHRRVITNRILAAPFLRYVRLLSALGSRLMKEPRPFAEDEQPLRGNVAGAMASASLDPRLPSLRQPTVMQRANLTLTLSDTLKQSRLSVQKAHPPVARTHRSAIHESRLCCDEARNKYIKRKE